MLIDERKARQGIRHFQSTVRVLMLAHHESATGRAAAADIEHRKALGALDLVITRGSGHLAITIEHLTHAGAADRMSDADKPAAGIHRYLATHLDRAFLNRLPRLARLGDAEVVDRHVLGGRKAIVGLDTRDLRDA